VTTAIAPSSPAVASRLGRLMYVGTLSEANAQARGGRLIASTHGAEGAPDHIRLSLVVDNANIVRDARFTSNAEGDLLAAYDGMCELIVGKPVIEASKVSPKQVEAHLRGAQSTEAFPVAVDGDQPFYVLRKASERLTQDNASKVAPAEKPYHSCGLFEKVRRVEAVLDEHVRPALASDGGGIDLMDLQGDILAVEYHGACGSCSSSVGGTLQFVQDSLNNHLGASLTVRVGGLDEEPPFNLGG
jgi:Fe-S cluster biogenesis protein NfuA/NifU-like protein involved in Fe-S cluster formation